MLLILGVDFALLWGVVVAFLLSFIPAVGFWLALIPPFLLALLEFGLTLGVRFTAAAGAFVIERNACLRWVIFSKVVRNWLLLGSVRI